MDPLCDATCRYIHLDCLNPPLSLFAATYHHTRGLKPQTSPTSPQKVVYYGAIMTPSYSSENLSLSPRCLMVTAATGADPLSMTLSALMGHSWPDRGSYTHTTPMPLVTSVSHAHSKCWNTFIGGKVWKPALDGRYDAASSVRHEKSLAKQFAGLHFLFPCPTAPEYTPVLTILGPCRSQLEEILTSSSSRTASVEGWTSSLLLPWNLQLKEPPTFR